MSKNLGLGMGLSLRAVSGAAPAFTPASLFTGTDEGFWADVTPSRLWQDVARTTPVTAAGQSVASWELTTRTGVIYAEQASAPARPTYQLDGSAGFLQFAPNQVLVTPTITPPTDKVQAFAGIANDITVGGTRVLLESSPVTDTNAGAFMFYYGVTGSFTDMRFRSKGTLITDTDSADIIPNLTKTTITGLGDISGDSNILRVNGTQVASSSADQGTGNFLAYPIYIGARSGPTIGHRGRIYGLAVRFGPNLTAGQITDMEGWMASVLNP